MFRNLKPLALVIVVVKIRVRGFRAVRNITSPLSHRFPQY
jgi:hypothetical protein